MTQPDKPAPSRGTRPQLFGGAGGGTSSKSRHSDFGPSILATIDGAPKRDARSRDATPLKRVLWMSALALGSVGVYFGVKFGTLPSSSSSSPVLVVAMQPPAVDMKPAMRAAVVVPEGSAASATSGVASIETIAQPVAAAASASAEARATTSATATLTNIQQTLEQSDTAESSKATKPAAMKEVPLAKRAVRSTEVVAANKDSTELVRPMVAPQKSGRPGNDSDADLIAAMLPHLKRRGLGPTSPAYEKRCGQFAGDAAAECWNKFCNGREGVDAACPIAQR